MAASNTYSPTSPGAPQVVDESPVYPPVSQNYHLLVNEGPSSSTLPPGTRVLQHHEEESNTPTSSNGQRSSEAPTDLNLTELVEKNMKEAFMQNQQQSRKNLVTLIGKFVYL